MAVDMPNLQCFQAVFPLMGAVKKEEKEKKEPI